jgi:hypothetical protein
MRGTLIEVMKSLDLNPKLMLSRADTTAVDASCYQQCSLELNKCGVSSQVN